MCTDGDHVMEVMQNGLGSSNEDREESEKSRQEPGTTAEDVTMMIAEDSTVQMRHEGCPRCLLNRVHYLPVFTVAFFVFTFLLSYSISVSMNHVEAFVPYISHTANQVPSKNIFAQLINMGAFLLAANMAIRFLQIRAYIKLIGAEPQGKKVNITAVISGTISSLGLTVVANFPTNEIQAVHYTGAFFALCGGVVYCWMQTILSLRFRRKNLVTFIHIGLSSAVTVIFLIFFCSKIIYRIQDSAGVGTKYDTLRPVYLVSTVAEWLAALIIIGFMLTFYSDFSNVRLSCNTVHITDSQLVRQRYQSRFMRDRLHTPTVV